MRHIVPNLSGPTISVIGPSTGIGCKWDLTVRLRLAFLEYPTPPTGQYFPIASGSVPPCRNNDGFSLLQDESGGEAYRYTCYDASLGASFSLSGHAGGRWWVVRRPLGSATILRSYQTARLRALLDKIYG
jgi:hypothetical protein